MSKTKIEVTLVDVPVDVEYIYYRGCRGARDGRYGPPLEPDEPPEVEIYSIKFNGIEMIEYVTDLDMEKIATDILDDIKSGE